jgi:hypothetical protein
MIFYVTHVIGTTEIGPGEYGVPSAACETQVDSRTYIVLRLLLVLSYFITTAYNIIVCYITGKPTKSAIRFGTGYTKNKGGVQKIDMKEPAPGPGSYNLPGGVATSRRGDPYRSAPAASMSGRNKFGSPW